MPSIQSGPAGRPPVNDDVAILLLEMQPHIVAASRTVGEADLRRSAAVVLGIARALGTPLLASAVPFGEQPPVLIDELSDVEPMARSVVSPFADPRIATTLRNSDRRTLVLGGVSSEIAILHTALDARREGYKVYVLVDLCGGLSARTEASAFDQIKAAGAKLSNISSVFTGLAGDMESPDGRAVMGGVAQLWSWGGPQ